LYRKQFLYFINIDCTSFNVFLRYKVSLTSVLGAPFSIIQKNKMKLLTKMEFNHRWLLECARFCHNVYNVRFFFFASVLYSCMSFLYSPLSNLCQIQYHCWPIDHRWFTATIKHTVIYALNPSILSLTILS
jgi:hypothetical protein